MFDKLSSRLAINPSHLDSFGDYSKKLRRNRAYWKLSIAFLALGLVVTVVSTTGSDKSVSIYSNDNIINGVSTKDDILSYWDNPQSDVAQIYSEFGIKRDDIANLSSSPDTTLHSKGLQNYWVLQRRIDGLEQVNNTVGSSVVNLEINKDIFPFAPLNALSDDGINYKAFQGRNGTTGRPFWIIASTGSYVQVGNTLAKSAPEKPAVIIKKSIIESPIQGTDQSSYKIVYEYRNTQPGSVARNVQITDRLDPKFSSSIETFDNASVKDDGVLTITIDQLPYEQYARKAAVAFDPSSDNALSLEACGNLSATSDNGGPYSTSGKQTPCTTLPAQTPTPGDSASVSVSLDWRVHASQSSGTMQENNTLKPGDSVEFTLTATNTSEQPVENFIMRDYIGDLLDYTEVDQVQLHSQNVTLNTSEKTLIWAPENIPPSSEVTKSFQARVKNPLPSTARASVLNSTYDCRITNTYGNTATLPIHCPPVKNLEKLPFISAKTVVLVSAGLLCGALILLRRNDDLLKEMKRVKKLYQQK